MDKSTASSPPARRKRKPATVTLEFTVAEVALLSRIVNRSIELRRYGADFEGEKTRLASVAQKLRRLS